MHSTPQDSVFDGSISRTLPVLLVGSYIIFKILHWIQKNYFTSIPVVGQGWFTSLVRKSKPWKQVLIDSYEKYSKNNKAFRLKNQVVVPPSAFAEYRKAPYTVLSSAAAIEDATHFGLWLGHDHSDVVNFVRTDVIRNIPNMIAPVREEIDLMFKQEFSASSPRATVFTDEKGITWQQIPLYGAVLTGVGRIATRMFAGRAYARNPDWTRTASDYANGILYNGFIFKNCPTILAPIVAKLVPTAKRIKKLRELIREDVLRYAAEKDLEDTEIDPDQEILFLRLLVKYVQANQNYHNANPEKVLKGTLGRLMGLMFAAIDTTTMTSTQVLFDLTSHPYDEYAGPIQREIENVSEKHGGKWTPAALNELKHLDSFIKESQRLHSIAVVLAQRVCTTRGGFVIKHAPGTKNARDIYVPKGGLVSLPLWALHTDSNNYEDPMLFKGFRFASDAAASSQPSDKFVAFGHGKHACPGRNLALVIIKLIVIDFLNKFEFQPYEKRPEDMMFGTAVLPNVYEKITLRERM